MATTKFFLDTRRTKPGSSSVLKVVITNCNTRSYVSLDAKLLPEQWDADHSRVINHPDEQRLNLYISRVQHHVNRIILFLTEDGRVQGMTANEIRDEIERRLNPDKVEKKEQRKQSRDLFITRFLAFAESKKPSTRGLYMCTYRRMRDFIGEQRLNRLRFEDITKEWLTDFDNFMAKTAKSKTPEIFIFVTSVQCSMRL